MQFIACLEYHYLCLGKFIYIFSKFHIPYEDNGQNRSVLENRSDILLPYPALGILNIQVITPAISYGQVVALVENNQALLT